MKGKPKEQFKKPDNKKLTVGDQRSIPNVTCDSVSSARAQIQDAGFDVSVLTGQVDSKCPAGTVAGTNPSGRTIKGGVVMIEISNGKGGAQQPQPGNPSPPTIPGFPPRPRR
jgi:beta-lactam-binding protein with PASTA domain